MALRVIGAGLGRTGTTSLKLALEQLLGAPCYQMGDVYRNPEHVALWHDAVRGRMPRWEDLFNGYAAAVDWPVASFYEEVGAVWPQALVVLSARDPQAWWRSARDTLFDVLEKSDNAAWRGMVRELFAARFTRALADKDACIQAFERHNALVRERVPADRLLEWQPGDGWEPLCRALGVPVPGAPFPHANTRAAFQSRNA